MTISILRGITFNTNNINEVDVNTTDNPGVFPDGAIIVDRNSNTLKIGDGATQGGLALSLASSVAWSSITGKPANLDAISGDNTDFVYDSVANKLTVEGSIETGAVTITDTTNSNTHLLSPLAGALNVEGGLSVNQRATLRELRLWDGAKVNQPNYLTLYNYESATGRVSEYYGIKMIRDYTGNADAPNSSEIGEIAFGWENTGGENIGASLKARRDDVGGGYNAYVEVGGSLALTVNSSLGIDVVGNITAPKIVSQDGTPIYLSTNQGGTITDYIELSQPDFIQIHQPMTIRPTSSIYMMNGSNFQFQAGGTIDFENATVSNLDYSSLSNTPTTLAGYGITDAYTQAEVDSAIADVTAGHFDFNITGDDSTVRTVQSGSTIGIVGGTGITTASDANGNITITGSGSTSIIKAYAHVDVSTPITASADYNVASVVSNSTGKYDVTFTNALPNANYVVSLSVQTNVSSNHYTVCYYNRTTTGFQVQKFLNGALDSGASGNFSFVIYQA